MYHYHATCLRKQRKLKTKRYSQGKAWIDYEDFMKIWEFLIMKISTKNIIGSADLHTHIVLEYGANLSFTTKIMEAVKGCNISLAENYDLEPWSKANKGFVSFLKIQQNSKYVNQY